MNTLKPAPVVATIAGTRYTAIVPPLRADHRLYLAGELAAAGLDRVRATMDAAATPTDGARDVFVLAARSGRLPWVAAGMLVEVGRRWNRRDAMALAERFAALTDPADSAAFDLAIAMTLLGIIHAQTIDSTADVDLAVLGAALETFTTSHDAPASPLH